MLLALALSLGFDNWRSGMGWAKDGPQSGYLPFYLCVILAGASLFGLGVASSRAHGGGEAVRHARPAAARHAGVRADFVFVALMHGSASTSRACCSSRDSCASLGGSRGGSRC